MNKEQKIQNINLLSTIIEKGKGNPHFTTKELENALQSNCDNILYSIPLENIIRHLLNNRDEEILIPNYFLPEHILQEVKERFDKDLTTEKAKDIIENLSNIDNLSERITETVFEFVSDILRPELEKEAEEKRIIEEKEAEEKRIIEEKEKRTEEAKKRREEDYAELKEKTPSHLELVIKYWDIDDTTTKRKIYFLNKDGELEGLYQEFHTNGNIWRESTYKEGKREGLEKVFYANGGLHISRMYQNDKLHGEIKELNTVGNIVYEAIFENGIMQQ